MPYRTEDLFPSRIQAQDAIGFAQRGDMIGAVMRLSRSIQKIHEVLVTIDPTLNLEDLLPEPLTDQEHYDAWLRAAISPREEVQPEA